MKTFVLLVLMVTLLTLPVAFAQASGGAGTVNTAASAITPRTGGCATCAAMAALTDTGQAVTVKAIPGTNVTFVVGRIENLIPIGVLTVLGCEQCAAEAVRWALQQGSSFDDVERTVQTVAAMQKLDCFKSQFGPDVNARMQKPLAAAEEALTQARTRAAK